MGRTNVMPKHGCEVLKNLNDALTPEDIRKAIEDGTIEAEEHAVCPFSCPWKYGCKVLKNLADALTGEDSRRKRIAIEDRGIDGVIEAIEDKDHAACPFSCPWKYECKALRNLADALTPEDIRKAIEDRGIDGVIEAYEKKYHAACSFSCPWRIRKYIKDLENPNFLIQNIVEEGGRNIKEDNASKVLPKTMEVIQDLDDPKILVTTKTKQKVVGSILDLGVELERIRKTTPQPI